MHRLIYVLAIAILPFISYAQPAVETTITEFNGGEYGAVRTFGENGTPNVTVSSSAANPNVGAVTVHNQNGTPMVTILDAAGSTSGFGYISVRGTSGTTDKAGMFLNGSNQGVLFADIKNFRMAHPSQPQTEIWYASLEGPEAGAYDRGTANLVNGVAVVSFSEHFKEVINSSTMTVQLTSHSQETYGLAVIEKNEEGFVVRELQGQSGNFSFDWEVKAVRKGFENYKAVRKVSEVASNKSAEVIKDATKEVEIETPQCDHLNFLHLKK